MTDKCGFRRLGIPCLSLKHQADAILNDAGIVIWGQNAAEIEAAPRCFGIGAAQEALRRPLPTAVYQQGPFVAVERFFDIAFEGCRTCVEVFAQASLHRPVDGHAPSLGTSFVLFYASGYLPFLFYSTLQAHVQQALTYSRPLLVFPAVSWVDAVAARFVLNTVTGLAVVAIVLGGLALTTGEVRIHAPGQMLFALILAALLGLGLGVANCLLVGLFPLWGQVWSIISRPLFLVAGVIFVMEDLPAGIQEWLFFTPWIHITGQFRAGLYAGYEASYVSVPLVVMWALVPLAPGLAFLQKHRNTILQMP